MSSLDRTQADAVAVAVDLIVDALTDGVDPNEVAYITLTDRRATAIAITMFAWALRSSIDDRAEADGRDGAQDRAIYIEAMRFETMAQLADVALDDPPRSVLERLRIRRREC